MAIELLIIRLSAIGDVVHALPVAAMLKQQIADVRITWVVEPAAAPLLQNNPAVDEVLLFPGKALLQAAKPFSWNAKKLSEGRQFLRALRSRHFDLAIDVQGLLKSALLARLSGAPIRVGFKQAREFGDRFMTHLVDVGDYFGADRHVVELNLALAEKAIQVLAGNYPEAPVPIFPLPELDERTRQSINEILYKGLTRAPNMPPSLANGAAPNLLSSSQADKTGNPSADSPALQVLPTSKAQQPLGFPVTGEGENLPPRTESSNDPSVVSSPSYIMSRPGPKASANLLGETVAPPKRRTPLVVLIPGTTWSSKIWAAEEWAGLARMILAGERFSTVIIGGPADRDRNQLIEKSIVEGTSGRVVNLTAKTSILDLIALFSQADLVVGADTGPLHIAAATGKPKVVAIFGSTPSGRNGPYGNQCASIFLGLSCQPCFAKICPLGTTACLRDLSYQYVFQRIRPLLEAL